MDRIEEGKEKEKKKNGEDDEANCKNKQKERSGLKDKKCCEILILMRNNFTTHAMRMILLSIVKGQVQAAHYRERTY